MNLKSWAEQERGRAMALAKCICVPPSFVSKMLSGEKAIPAEHCKAIHAFTGGEVTLQELRPDDWQKFWPCAASPVPCAPVCVTTATPAVAQQGRLNA
jgi:DNA-binding transcriptional regulator YdaS (Cro superfamily)